MARMSKSDRPCIKVCRFDEVTGWCFGCGMTKPERKAWKQVAAFRPVILDQAPARLAALAGEGHVTGPAAGKKKPA